MGSASTSDPFALPETLVQVAERELNETPTARRDALCDLRAKLAQKGSLHRDDDAYLLMFLRWAKFNAEKAFKRLHAMEKWLKGNQQYLGDPQEFSKFRAEDFRNLYGGGWMTVLDGHATDGSQVVLLRPKKLVPGSLSDPALVLKWNVYSLYQAVDDPFLQVKGQLIVETFEGMSFLEAVRFGQGTIPSNIMKQNMEFMNKAAPFRLRGIWLFHQSVVVSVLMAIVRPFLSKKMKERIQAFGSDFTALHQLVDPAKLPPDFEGTSNDDGGWAWFEKLIKQEKANTDG